MVRQKTIGEKVYDEIAAPHYLVAAPFKTFEKIKEKKIGNYYSATIFIILFGIMNVVDYQYKGFVVNNNNPLKLNALLIIATSIIPLLIFVFANLALTTFFDGKGKLGEIYKVLGYSLYPFILCNLFSILLSNFITLEGVVFVKTIFIFGIIWTSLLLFIGLLIIHEYGVFKNVLSILLTFLTMIIIVFIILLMINLLQKLAGFSESLFTEIIYRIRGR